MAMGSTPAAQQVIERLERDNEAMRVALRGLGFDPEAVIELLTQSAEQMWRRLPFELSAVALSAAAGQSRGISPQGMSAVADVFFSVRRAGF
jgi:hypothetical protein